MLLALQSIVSETITEFVASVTDLLPRLLSALVFLTIAFVTIKVLRRYLRWVLRQVYPPDQRIIADVTVLVVSLFLWFGVGLALLKVVGLGDIAASLGTATGFVALGVSYALSNMLADVVAGVYLIRDQDFNPGDTVVADSTTGVVSEIGLRKSRLEVESGDTVVIANRDIEKKWTKRVGAETA